MRNAAHPIQPEELMAYLDGELAPARAAEAMAHLSQCADCRQLATDLRGVSREMTAWEIEAAEFGMRRSVTTAQPQRESRKLWERRSFWAVSLLVAGCLLCALLVQPRFFSPSLSQYGTRLKSEFNPPASSPQFTFEPGYGPVLPQVEKPKARNPLAAAAPLIARIAQISLTVSTFTSSRARLDAILAAHSGYAANLTVSTPSDSARSIDGAISVPSAQLDATLADLRQIGRVVNESQNGTDVTAQSADLDARLSNARNTEHRLLHLLDNRSGGLKDVLAVETELGRVRGEIESMEAQRKLLSTQVAMATITLHISEEQRSQLDDGNIGLRLRNAAIDGFRAVQDSLVGASLLLVSRGPVLVLWAAILFYPARLVYRRWRRR